MTYKDIKHNEEVNELLKKGNQNLGLLGYTEHSQAHCVRVAETAAHILKKFGYPEHDIELARIAGYMHDIGIGYGSINHPVDRDPLCGYNGIIDDTCPCCHRGETTRVTERIKRIKVD